MHSNRIVGAVALTMLCAPATAVAQDLSVTAITLQEAFAQSEFFNMFPLDRRAVLGGTDVSAGFQLDAGQGLVTASTSLSFPPPTASALPIVFSANAVNVTAGNSNGAAGSTGADLLLILHCATPVTGVLQVQGHSYPSGGSGLGSGVVTVDVDNDGVPELSLVPVEPFGRSCELAMTIGPQDRVVRIVHTGSVNTGANGADDYACHVEMVFVPNTCPIVAYGLAPARYTLGWQRSLTGRLDVLPSLPSDGLHYLVFGDQQLNQPLPFPPGEVQLTDVDFFIPISAQTPVQLPNVLLPSGYGINMQEVQFAADCTIHTSSALRMFSP